MDYKIGDLVLIETYYGTWVKSCITGLPSRFSTMPDSFSINVLETSTTYAYETLRDSSRMKPYYFTAFVERYL